MNHIQYCTHAGVSAIEIDEKLPSVAAESVLHAPYISSVILNKNITGHGDCVLVSLCRLNVRFQYHHLLLKLLVMAPTSTMGFLQCAWWVRSGDLHSNGALSEENDIACFSIWKFKVN